MANTYTSLNYHLVFSTKRRIPMIAPELEVRLYACIGDILRTRDGRLLKAGGTADHVHLLVSLSKDVTVTSTLRDIKCNSSGWVHKMFPDRRSFAWQAGYGAFTVSDSGLGAVRRYIHRQKEHHRKTSLREELTGLLTERDIELGGDGIRD